MILAGFYTEVEPKFTVTSKGEDIYNGLTDDIRDYFTILHLSVNLKN